MISAEVSAFLRMLKDFKHVSSNSKGTSLAKRFVSGLEIYEKSFIKPIKPHITKKTMDLSNIYRRGNCSITLILALSSKKCK
jgi:hypothetical protein